MNTNSKQMYKHFEFSNSRKSAIKLLSGDSLFLLFTLRQTHASSVAAANSAKPKIRPVDVSLDWNLYVTMFLRHLKYVKLIHAVKVVQIRFVAKMACVIMKILYSMQF